MPDFWWWKGPKVNWDRVFVVWGFCCCCFYFVSFLTWLRKSLLRREGRQAGCSLRTSPSGNLQIRNLHVAVREEKALLWRWWIKSLMSLFLQLVIIEWQGMLLRLWKSSRSRIAEMRWLMGQGTLLVYIWVLRWVHVLSSIPLLSFCGHPCLISSARHDQWKSQSLGSCPNKEERYGGMEKQYQWEKGILKYLERQTQWGQTAAGGRKLKMEKENHAKVRLILDWRFTSGGGIFDDKRGLDYRVLQPV